jgi:hypothetical protein
MCSLRKLVRSILSLERHSLLLSASSPRESCVGSIELDLKLNSVMLVRDKEALMFLECAAFGSVQDDGIIIMDN